MELQLRGGFSIGGEANGLSLHFLFLLYAIPRKSQALHGKFTELTGRPRQWLSLRESWREAPERARMLTENHKRGDSIALTEGLLIAARRLSGDGLALSVIASQCHLSHRERLSPAGSRNRFVCVPFRRKVCYTGLAALPADFNRRGGEFHGALSRNFGVCRGGCDLALYLQVA